MNFGNIPCLSKNMIRLTAIFNNHVGIIDNAFANMSVSFSVSDSLFSLITLSNFSFTSNIFSLPVNGIFIVVSSPSSVRFFFIAKDISISFLSYITPFMINLLSCGLCAINLTIAAYMMFIYVTLTFSSAFFDMYSSIPFIGMS